MLVVFIYLLAFLIIVGLAFWILGQIPGIPDPIRKVIYIVMVVIVVIVLVGWMLNFAGSGPVLPAFPRR